jgi:MtN3 and saliva related transmembrane protein
MKFYLPTEIIGTLAALITTLCWVPQLWQIFHTRDTKSISFASQGAFAVGISLWLIYGVMIESWPIIISNAVTLIFILAILILKMRYK